MKRNADPPKKEINYAVQALMFHFLPLSLPSLYLWSQKVFVMVRNLPKKDYHRGRDNGMQYTAKQETEIFFLNSCCPLLLNTLDTSYSVLG